MAIYYYLASGQSNMKGHATGGSFDMAPNLKVWNNQGNTNTLSNLGTAWVTPALGANPLNVSPLYNNLAVQAANVIAKSRPNDEIRLVLVAKSSQSIGVWYNGTYGAMWNRMIAVLDAAGVTHLDGFWWHQGESDDAAETDWYVGAFQGIIRGLRAAGLCGYELTVVLGECATKYVGSNAHLAAVAAASNRYELAKLALFPTTDTTHFTGPSLVSAGIVYAGLQLGLEP